MPVRSLRFALASLLVLLVLPARAQTPPQTVLFPGAAGAPLLDSLARVYTPDQTLGYGPARDVLYGEIDLQAERRLEGVYTGYPVTLDEGADPSSDAFQKGINTEHTWPQSLGAGDEPARSDMHHLFPTLVEANAERASNPFADIPDAQTDTWWYLNQQTSSIPDADIDLYSESTPSEFEPREQHKGNVARAMFYFYTVYRTSEAFLEQQKETLRHWHEVVDPVDRTEYDRSQAIAARQGNPNPFVLDSSLVRRAFFSEDSGGGGGGGTDTTALDAGALVVVGFNSDPPRTFAFVPLVNLPAGTELLFTDNGARSDGSFRANEGTLRYTAGSMVEAGTVVVYDESAAHPFEVVEGSFATSTGGDQILAYREDEGERTFLYAVHFAGGAWDDDATDSNTSALPPGLEEGVTAVAVGDADNGVYTGPADLVPTEVRRRVSDAAAWQLSDEERQDMPSENWPLPVELTTFEVVVDGTEALLTWSTASETNNAFFEVQHRTDAQDEFEVLASVDGHGTTNEPQDYAYRAADLSSGTHYFRLKQVDFDGAFSYSDVVEAVVSTDSEALAPGRGPLRLLPPAPHPFRDRTTVRLLVPQPRPVRVELFDALGRRVRVVYDGTPSGSTLRLDVDGAGLPPGLYLLRAAGASTSVTRRLVRL